MAFKIPKLTVEKHGFFEREAKKLPQFNWQDLSDKDEIGQGAFGCVFSANYQERKVVVKKLIGGDRNQKEKFVKEARLLHSLKCKNIVQFEGICISPTAIMLEYLYFDFSPFVDSRDIRVSSLEEFLTCFHELNAVDAFPVQDKVVRDVTKGLQFLHANDCFHRDLKTANVLVSNQHYCFLENMNDIVDAFNKEPIVCKLADFGESRGREIQTQEVVNTCTNNVGRGTPSFMAPEILSSNKLSEVRALDLRRIDIWALGMVIFCVLNPDIAFPYKRDLELARSRCKEHFNALTYIRELLTQQRKPTESGNYQERQRERWGHLVQAYQECTNFEPSSRPSLNHVLEILDSSHARYHDVIPLRVHQGSVIEKADEQIALGLDDISTTMRNDGTNSCAFLCVIIGDQLLNGSAEKTQHTWQDIAILAENVIRKSPSSFNDLRDKKLLYDGEEASSILWKGGILQSRYEMTEEIISPDGVFSEKGRTHFMRAVGNLRTPEERVSVALYTCSKTVVLVGVLDGQFFVIDTHSRVENRNGDKVGCLVVFEKHPHDVEHLYKWILEGLRAKKVKDSELQSFSLMKKFGYSCLKSRTNLRPEHNDCENQQENKADSTSGNEVHEENEDEGDDLVIIGEKTCSSKVENIEVILIEEQNELSSEDQNLRHSQSCAHETSTTKSNNAEPLLLEDDQDLLQSPFCYRETSTKKTDNAELLLEDEDQDLLQSPFGYRETSTEKTGKTNKNTQSNNVNSFADPSAEITGAATINGLPIFKCSDRGLGMNEILRICVEEKVPKDKICRKLPTMVQRSAVFVIDLSSVNHIDLAADDCGVYGCHSSPSVRVEVGVDDEGNLESSVRTMGKDEAPAASSSSNVRQFTVRRQYSWHSLSKDYRRIITKVEEKDKIMRFATVQYIVKTNNTSKLFERPHGHSKKTKAPYLRTKPSVLQKIRQLGQNQASAKRIISDFEKQAGDVVCISSPSSLPRDRNQVYKQVRNVPGRIRSRSTGPAAAPDLTKLLSLQYSGSFVRNISFSASMGKDGAKRAAPNTFAASDTCLQWVKRFCRGTSPEGVAGIDMTYKLGPFYLTTLTFPNPMFVLKSSDQKHPTTLAAIMTSTTKEKRDYEYMARSLKSEGITSLTYGMDGECAMEKGFEEIFPIHNGSSGANIHLRCFDHVQSDIDQKLLALKVTEVERRAIISDILGQENRGIRTVGLVDCATKEDFERRYVEVEKKWPEEFKNWMKTTTGRLRPLTETLKECMLKPVRTAAGLGDPPNKWSNQRTESLNNVIKEANQNHVTDQAEVHEVIEANVVKQQESEYIKAIYNTGEYRLAPKYQRYSVSPLEWSRKTDEQRKEHVKRVLGCRSETVAEESQNQVITKKLSVDLINSGIDSVSPGLLNSLWHQAEVILSHHQVIDLNNNAFCVTEHGTSTNVTQERNGSITCQCKNAKSTAGLCQHTLAVAHKLGILSAYLSKWNMRNNKAGRILNEQVPKRAGEKPREKKKRKGQNNIQSTPIVTEKRKADDDIDFPKPMYFSEIWHNRNSFEIAFTRDVKKIIKCESCKVEFAQGPVVCVPHDIAVMHKERYYYPKKDDKGQVQMVPTFHKEATKFYCVRKSCLLKRHPYFWKDMLTVDDKVLPRLKEGHKRHLQLELHFVC